jgi:hypothetical protein
MDKQNENAQRAKVRAEEYAPGENWIEMSPGICMAASRAPKSAEQVKTLEKEMEHARILAGGGHAVYLLPEHGPRGVKHPDAVVDGFLYEFKTVTGNIRKIAGNFKAAREKAENVFLEIIPDYSKEAVQKKLKGTIKNKDCSGGLIIAHFKVSGKIYYWNVDDLK